MYIIYICTCIEIYFIYFGETKYIIFKDKVNRKGVSQTKTEDRFPIRKVG